MNENKCCGDCKSRLKERFEFANKRGDRFIDVTEFLVDACGRMAVNEYLTDDHFYLSIDQDGVFLNWE